MQEFSRREVPHYPGELTAIRAFQINSSGILGSPQRTHTWLPGENQARCNLSQGGIWLRPRGSAFPNVDYYPFPGHEIGCMDCQCGFYAYFDQKNAGTYLPGRPSTAVLGIVKAYGRLTVGEHGLRATKMKIVGIVPQHPPAEPLPEKPEMPTGPKLHGRWVYVALAMIWLGTAVQWAFDSALTDFIGAVLIVLGFVGEIGLLAGDFTRAMKYRKAVKDFIKKSDAWCSAVLDDPAMAVSCDVPPQVVQKFKGLYPDVKVYDSLEQALEENPLSSYDEI